MREEQKIIEDCIGDSYAPGLEVGNLTSTLIPLTTAWLHQDKREAGKCSL